MNPEHKAEAANKFAQISAQGTRAPFFNAADLDGFAAAHETASITSIRYNPAKTAAIHSGENLEVVPWCETGRYLPERPLFTADPLFHAGTYYVQEASSMFTGYAFQYLMQRGTEPLKVLDLCAAPGGKSTLLASLIQQSDLLVANETIQPRASILAENLSRWGYANIWVTNNDPSDFTKIAAWFDCLLIDAPCTGSGLWRKDEAAIDEWSPEHVRLCADRQKRIIADALPALKDGGLLLYATCSYSPEENEDVADWICDNFQAETLRIPLPEGWGIKETGSRKHGAFGYRFYPWNVAGEGFFISAFYIGNDKEPVKALKQKGNSRNKPSTEATRWQPYLNAPLAITERNGEYYGMQPGHQEYYNLLSQYLRIKKGGTRLGKLLPKEALPDHELALSIHLSKEVPAVALSREEAIQYLKKEEVKRAEVKGWNVATFEGHALGWGKWMPGRMNNYLPKNWRIRMEL